MKPGLLGTYARFRREFGVSNRGRAIRQHHRLRTTLREVMVRNRRSTAGVALPPRHAAIQWVDLVPAERVLYNLAVKHLRAQSSERSSFDAGRFATIQRRITSTPQATRQALKWINEPAVCCDMEDWLADVEVGGKAWALQKLCLLYPEEPMLIFSEFRESVEAIAGQLAVWGESVAHWHGGMSIAARQDALAKFRSGTCRLLVGSDGLAEGQNLQHCRILVNLDLPWNPFRIEQRVGRVHRLGQKREVFQISLVARDTFEADLARTLVRKLHLFELSVGELDPILGELIQSESDWESYLTRIALAENREREQELTRFARILGDAYARHRGLARKQDLVPELSALEEER